MFNIFAQNIDYGYTFINRTGNLHVCFVAKIRKNRYTPAYPSFVIKSGVCGVYTICYPDVVIKYVGFRRKYK